MFFQPVVEMVLARRIERFTLFALMEAHRKALATGVGKSMPAARKMQQEKLLVRFVLE
jgi:hypothetical protein